MTLTKEMIEAVSPYSVGEVRSAKVMTPGDFKWYCTLAVRKLTKDAPVSIDVDTYDLAEAYYVCHLKSIQVTGDNGDMQSESIGGYSYSRKNDVKSGSSNYEALYFETLKGKKHPSMAITRSDVLLPAEFQLDDTFHTDDGVGKFEGVL